MAKLAPRPTRGALLTLLVAMAGEAAGAGTCAPVKDLARYESEARTAQGRKSLADSYCLHARLARSQQTARERDACEEAQSRMLAALRTANDRKMVDRALSGCPDIFDRKPPPARTSVFKCESPDGMLSFSTAPCPQGWRTLTF